MDEALSLIIHGCELARKLESNLSDLTNHPTVLSRSCEEVVVVLRTAIQRLNSNTPSSSHSPMVFQELTESRPPETDAIVQEWLSSSYTQAMDLLLNSQFSSATNKDPFGKTSSTTRPTEVMGLQISAASTDHMKLVELGDHAEGSSRSKSTGAAEVQGMVKVPDHQSGRRPVGQRSSRKRKDGVDKRTVKVAAPRIGNTEIPPEDGFTWRKYGQKEILGSMFPRGYFRCTHKNFYGCEAKKQVQRLDEDPNIFEVTYYGQHTCHLSSSAPSAFPASQPPQPPEQPVPATTTTTTTTTSSIPSLLLNRWASTMAMEATSFLSTGDQDHHQSTHAMTSSFTDLQLPILYYKDFIGGSTGSSSGAGPSSTTQGGRDGKDNQGGECPVLDLADVMFNSGSSSNNSMGSIFPSMREK